jgi:hypothetical protein
MDVLKPGVVPYVFIAIAIVFAVNFLRHMGDDGERIAQRNRLRLALIFAVVGGGLLLWTRLF